MGSAPARWRAFLLAVALCAVTSALFLLPVPAGAGTSGAGQPVERFAQIDRVAAVTYASDGSAVGFSRARTRSEKRWVETPIGNISLRRGLAAVFAGVVTAVGLALLGLGGGSRARRILISLGGGLAVTAVALVALAG